MRPLGACTCRLHGPALLRTQKALRIDAEDTSPTQPVSNRHFDDAITGLCGEQQVGTFATDVMRQDGQCVYKRLSSYYDSAKCIRTGTTLLWLAVLFCSCLRCMALTCCCGAVLERTAAVTSSLRNSVNNSASLAHVFVSWWLSLFPERSSGLQCVRE